MPSNDNKPITEGLLDKKLEEKDHSNNICQSVIFVVIILVDLISTFVYCKYLRKYIITESKSYHNIPYFPFSGLSIALNFDNRIEQIPCFCYSKIKFKNDTFTRLKTISNWTHPNNSDLSYFILENAFEKEDLNLNEGDSLFIFFVCVY